MTQKNIAHFLLTVLKEKNLKSIRSAMKRMSAKVKSIPQNGRGFLRLSSESDAMMMSSKFLAGEIDQILETKTLGRTKYYIRRLVRSLTEKKTGKINDLNLHRWKEYGDILTDSLWILDKRDTSGAHTGKYWGNFIPQIPHQLLRRYTKKGEWVLDTFLGSGTTLIECQRLGRNGIGIELQPEIARMASRAIEKENNPYSIRTEVLIGNSSNFNFKTELAHRGITGVQFLIMHPPYWDIIHFSRNKKDLSNAKSIDDFLALFGSVVDASYPVLDKGRYFALVIGDKYSSGTWFPLGFYTMQEVLKRGYSLKSIIVKNFDQTRGKRNQKELWRYRALAGGFYIFKHEYIFLFKK